MSTAATEPDGAVGRELEVDNEAGGGAVVWRAIAKVLVVTGVIFLVESASYFVVAEYFGELVGVDHTANLQLPIDRVTPWFTPLVLVYAPWPFVWFFVIPAIVLAATGKDGFARYTINSMMMYVVGSVIYALFPTTTRPADFINGTFMTLPEGAPFHDAIVELSKSADNIWGSCPSYHNYWASLFIILALAPGVKAGWRYPMVVLGGLITLSTLMLHQHCVMDVVITYAMTGLFLFITIKLKLDKKLIAWFIKPARTAKPSQPVEAA
ncbi:MAG: phosphatase PAP2 family protein [Bifidobacteriaceae bacterium]|nr:phosphatase PAP2 family protein [Bifidobacteriaceae bacterium]